MAHYQDVSGPPVRVLLFIDSLGSGGAQRQMAALAMGLLRRGFAVEVLTYQPHLMFYRDGLARAGIPIHEIQKGSGFSWAVTWRLVSWLRERRFTAIVSFLDAPNLYAEMAKALALSRIRLIVGERAGPGQRHGWRRRLSMIGHLMANVVASNSESQGQWLRQQWGLRKKTVVVYNGYEHREWSLPDTPRPRTYLVIARVDANKNALRLAEALALYHQRHGVVPIVEWAGRQGEDAAALDYRRSVDEYLARHPAVARAWHWMGETTAVATLLDQSHALIHVSLSEGLPNSVCEALWAGRPVIASSVCDHPKLVPEGVRGFLCDAESPDSICAALERSESLPFVHWRTMASAGRAYAEQHLALDRMVDRFASLLTGGH